MSAPQGYGYPGGYSGPGQQPVPQPSAGYGQLSGEHGYGPAGGPPHQYGYGPDFGPRAGIGPQVVQPAWKPTQRPGVIAVSASMAITASLMWMVALGFALLTAVSVRSTFDTSDQVQGAIYIVVDRFLLRMGQGLAIFLFGFPLAAVVAGFMLLARKAWARIVFSALGVASLGWSAWWLHLHLVWWVPLVVYIGLAAALPWLSSVSRWYADRPGRPDPQSSQPVPPSVETPPPTPGAPYGTPYGQYR